MGLYAELIDVNAYHQPGVDKHAAAGVLALQGSVLSYLGTATSPKTAAEVALAIGAPDRVEMIFTLLEHLAISQDRGVRMRNWSDAGNALFWLFSEPVPETAGGDA